MIATLRKLITSLRARKQVAPGIAHIFLGKEYQMHNVARLAHLESLGFALAGKRVLEFGAGIGDHTFYYLTKGCHVISTDVRRELVEFISNRFDVTALTMNAETDLDKIKDFEKCDIIHCYGLLYHIQNPAEFLRSLSDKCDLLLLETCVSHDLRVDGEYIIHEDKGNPTQAVSGRGCRPTRRWIHGVLSKGFRNVYFPKTQPDHPEFPLDWGIATEDRQKLIRAIFVASQTDLAANCRLTTSMPLKYDVVEHQSPQEMSLRDYHV